MVSLNDIGPRKSREGRILTFALIAAALALGSPSGWMCWRLLTGASSSIASELSRQFELYCYLFLTTTVVFGIFGGVLGALIHDREEQAEKMRELSLTDALTSLRNTRYFHERLGEELARVRRTGLPLTLIMLDLDYFKRINDRFGHEAGDSALTHVGAVLGECVRESDVACRVGGEEFAIICPDTHADSALELANRIRLALEFRGWPGAPHGEHLTASFGLAECGPDGTADALFRAADAALYEAKSAGRNNARVAPEVGGDPGPVEPAPAEGSPGAGAPPA